MNRWLSALAKAKRTSVTSLDARSAWRPPAAAGGLSGPGLHGNPYDGHTLKAALEQVQRIAGADPEQVFVDMGYRGHGYSGDVEVHVDKRHRGRIDRSLWRWMKRRAAIEPGIGHRNESIEWSATASAGLGRSVQCHPERGGMNFHKLLRWVAAFLRQIFCWLLYSQRTTAMSPAPKIEFFRID